MDIEELRIRNKDSFIAAEIVCPNCGSRYEKRGAYHCPKCFVKIFDRDENGQVTLIDPDTADKSRKFKVIEPSGAESEHFPGELVCVSMPALTDSSAAVSADGIELCLETENGQLTGRFLMPSHDVTIEKSCVNNMSIRPQMHGMGGMGGMGGI